MQAGQSLAGEQTARSASPRTAELQPLRASQRGAVFRYGAGGGRHHTHPTLQFHDLRSLLRRDLLLLSAAAAARVVRPAQRSLWFAP